MREKIFVLGSQGFIGENLINYLKKKNYQTTSIGKKKKFIRDNKINHIKTDIYSYENYAKYLDKNSIIVFLAASKFNLNLVKKFRKLIKIFEQKKIKKFLFLSSASVYGNNTNIISEKVNKKPINKQGIFFIKLEDEILKVFKKSNTNYVILRTFNVFGKNRKKNGMIENFIKKIKKNDKFFYASDLHSVRSYIGVSDLIKIIFKLSFNYKKNLIMNICNPYFIYSLKDISEKIYDMIGKKFHKIICRKKKNIIDNSICYPKKLIKMKLLEFKKNFNFELNEIMKTHY